VNYPFNISKGGAILAPVGSSLSALKVGKTEENKAWLAISHQNHAQKSASFLTTLTEARQRP